MTLPIFVVELEPWYRVFLRNLADSLWPRRRPALHLSSLPGSFWTDVFVTRGLPWRRFLDSAVYHAGVISALWLFATYWPRPRVVVQPPLFDHSDVIYYAASEYLPPLDTGGKHLQLPPKGDPEYAAQPIISVPPEADNRRQTIVTPPNVKLDHDVPLPNIVAWSQTRQPEIPLAATARSASDLRLLTPSATAVAPAPELNKITADVASLLPQNAIAPPPDVKAAGSLRTLDSPQAAVVEPPPVVQAALTRRVGDVNIGHTQAVAPAPALPMEDRRAVGGRESSLGSIGNAAVVPPPPSIPGATGGSSTGGRIIALGIHPVAPTGPVEIPAGNRRGTFAATPHGKPGASGTPEAMTDSSQNGTSGAGRSNGSGNGEVKNGVPPGLYVGPAEPKSAVAGNGQGNGTGGTSPLASQNSTLMASAKPPRVTSNPRPATEIDHPTPIERKVFGERKLYSMTLNMPNLNSAGGSWVIRFAEINEGREKGALTAPEAIHKVDPAYPLELMRRNVEGTVTLYAVIHSDGSVGDVRVLEGVDDRLDAYARAAFLGWKFYPATKNGAAVALEAVVTIPFRPLRRKLGF